MKKMFLSSTTTINSCNTNTNQNQAKIIYAGKGIAFISHFGITANYAAGRWHFYRKQEFMNTPEAVKSLQKTVTKKQDYVSRESGGDLGRH